MRLLATLLLLTALPAFGDDDTVPPHANVVLETNLGNIVIELDGRRAPLTVQHFLQLVDSGYYDGTIFHRVVPDFVVQGGGYDRDLELREPRETVVNESGNGLTNLRTTVAMAREPAPHSARAQFYINLKDNRDLDPKPTHWGYTVFGYVVEGMEVADRMGESPTGPAGPFRQDVPVAAIIIEKAHRR